MGAAKFGYPGWHDDPDGAAGGGTSRRSVARVRAHAPSAPADRDEGRHHLPLPACDARRGARTAREAANGLDVRVGGGPSTICEFLAAGLVDHLHVTVVPILLGRGVRLWDGLEGLERDYRVEATSSPSGVTHVTLTRTGGPAQG